MFKSRLINIYWSFSLQHNISQRTKFQYQLQLIKLAFTNSTIILGDLNLDWAKRYNTAYSHKNYFEDFEMSLGNLHLNQLIDFNTDKIPFDDNIQKF